MKRNVFTPLYSVLAQLFDHGADFAQRVEREAASKWKVNDVSCAKRWVGSKSETYRARQVHRRNERCRFRVVGVPDTDFRLFSKVAKQLTQFFKRLMIETHIVQNRHLGREQCNRSIAFIDFADEDIALPYPRTGKGRIISNEIFHHCAVHDGGITAGVRQYPADHAGYRRFSARSTHRNAARCGVEQVCEQFGACHTGTAKCIGLGDIRNAVLNSCRGNEYLVTTNDAAAILRKQVDA